MTLFVVSFAKLNYLLKHFICQTQRCACCLWHYSMNFKFIRRILSIPGIIRVAFIHLHNQRYSSIARITVNYLRQKHFESMYSICHECATCCVVVKGSVAHIISVSGGCYFVVRTSSNKFVFVG